MYSLIFFVGIALGFLVGALTMLVSRPKEKSFEKKRINVGPISPSQANELDEESVKILNNLEQKINDLLQSVFIPNEPCGLDIPTNEKQTRKIVNILIEKYRAAGWNVKHVKSDNWEFSLDDYESAFKEIETSLQKENKK